MPPCTTPSQADEMLPVEDDGQSFAPGDTVTLIRTPSTPPTYNVENDIPGMHLVVRCDHAAVDRSDYH